MPCPWNIQAHTLYFLPSCRHIDSNVQFPILVLPSFLGFLLVFFRNKAATRRHELASRAASNTSSRGHRISRRYPHKETKYAVQIPHKWPNSSYFNFYTRHKVDGKGFSSQMPTLKTVPSDQKSNLRTCAEECQMPFNSFLTFKKVEIIEPNARAHTTSILNGSSIQAIFARRKV